MTCYVALNDQDSSGSLNYLLKSHLNRVIILPSDTAGFSSFIEEKEINQTNLKIEREQPKYYAGL